MDHLISSVNRTLSTNIENLTLVGTATSGLDYVATNGTLSLAPGQKIATFTVTISTTG